MTDQIDDRYSDLPPLPTDAAPGSGAASTLTVEDVTEAMKDVLDP